MVTATNLRLFATLQDGNGGLAQIYCDGHQRFVFERTDRNATTVERLVSTDPRDFHDYTRSLSQAGWSFAWANG
jgi:hypothetical protein